MTTLVEPLFNHYDLANLCDGLGNPGLKESGGSVSQALREYGQLSDTPAFTEFISECSCVKTGGKMFTGISVSAGLGHHAIVLYKHEKLFGIINSGYGIDGVHATRSDGKVLPHFLFQSHDPEVINTWFNKVHTISSVEGCYNFTIYTAFQNDCDPWYYASGQNEKTVGLGEVPDHIFAKPQKRGTCFLKCWQFALRFYLCVIRKMSVDEYKEVRHRMRIKNLNQLSDKELITVHKSNLSEMETMCALIVYNIGKASKYPDIVDNYKTMLAKTRERMCKDAHSCMTSLQAWGVNEIGEYSNGQLRSFVKSLKSYISDGFGSPKLYEAHHQRERSHRVYNSVRRMCKRFGYRLCVAVNAVNALKSLEDPDRRKEYILHVFRLLDALFFDLNTSPPEDNSSGAKQTRTRNRLELFRIDASPYMHFTMYKMLTDFINVLHDVRSPGDTAHRYTVDRGNVYPENPDLTVTSCMGFRLPSPRYKPPEYSTRDNTRMEYISNNDYKKLNDNVGMNKDDKDGIQYILDNWDSVIMHLENMQLVSNADSYKGRVTLLSIRDVQSYIMRCAVSDYYNGGCKDKAGLFKRCLSHFLACYSRGDSPCVSWSRVVFLCGPVGDDVSEDLVRMCSEALKACISLFNKLVSEEKNTEAFKVINTGSWIAVLMIKNHTFYNMSKEFIIEFARTFSHTDSLQSKFKAALLQNTQSDSMAVRVEEFMKSHSTVDRHSYLDMACVFSSSLVCILYYWRDIVEVSAPFTEHLCIYNSIMTDCNYQNISTNMVVDMLPELIIEHRIFEFVPSPGVVVDEICDVNEFKINTSHSNSELWLKCLGIFKVSIAKANQPTRRSILHFENAQLNFINHRVVNSEGLQRVMNDTGDKESFQQRVYITKEDENISVLMNAPRQNHAKPKSHSPLFAYNFVSEPFLDSLLFIYGDLALTLDITPSGGVRFEAKNSMHEVVYTFGKDVNGNRTACIKHPIKGNIECTFGYHEYTVPLSHLMPPTCYMYFKEGGEGIILADHSLTIIFTSDLSSMLSHSEGFESITTEEQMVCALTPGLYFGKRGLKVSCLKPKRVSFTMEHEMSCKTYYFQWVGSTTASLDFCFESRDERQGTPFVNSRNLCQDLSKMTLSGFARGVMCVSHHVYEDEKWHNHCENILSTIRKPSPSPCKIQPLVFKRQTTSNSNSYLQNWTIESKSVEAFILSRIAYDAILRDNLTGGTAFSLSYDSSSRTAEYRYYISKDSYKSMSQRFDFNKDYLDKFDRFQSKFKPAECRVDTPHPFPHVEFAGEWFCRPEYRENVRACASLCPEPQTSFGDSWKSSEDMIVMPAATSVERKSVQSERTSPITVKDIIEMFQIRCGKNVKPEQEDVVNEIVNRREDASCKYSMKHLPTAFGKTSVVLPILIDYYMRQGKDVCVTTTNSMVNETRETLWKSNRGPAGLAERETYGHRTFRIQRFPALQLDAIRDRGRWGGVLICDEVDDLLNPLKNDLNVSVDTIGNEREPLFVTQRFDACMQVVKEFFEADGAGFEMEPYRRLIDSNSFTPSIHPPEGASAPHKRCLMDIKDEICKRALKMRMGIDYGFSNINVYRGFNTVESRIPERYINKISDAGGSWLLHDVMAVDEENEAKPSPLHAVPYRAKDTPSQTSMFSDIDLTMILTILCVRHARGIPLSHIIRYTDLLIERVSNHRDKYSLDTLVAIGSCGHWDTARSDQGVVNAFLKEVCTVHLKVYVNIERATPHTILGWHSGFDDVIGFTGTVQSDTIPHKLRDYNWADTRGKLFPTMPTTSWGDNTKVRSSQILRSSVLLVANKSLDGLIHLLDKDKSVVALVDAGGYYSKVPNAKLVERVRTSLDHLRNVRIGYVDERTRTRCVFEGDGSLTTYSGTETLAFVYYDQSSITGTDFVIGEGKGLVTYDPMNSTRDLMQAIGRMRGIADGTRPAGDKNGKHTCQFVSANEGFQSGSDIFKSAQNFDDKRAHELRAMTLANDIAHEITNSHTKFNVRQVPTSFESSLDWPIDKDITSLIGRSKYHWPGTKMYHVSDFEQGNPSIFKYVISSLWTYGNVCNRQILYARSDIVRDMMKYASGKQKLTGEIEISVEAQAEAQATEAEAEAQAAEAEARDEAEAEAQAKAEAEAQSNYRKMDSRSLLGKYYEVMKQDSTQYVLSSNSGKTVTFSLFREHEYKTKTWDKRVKVRRGNIELADGNDPSDMNLSDIVVAKWINRELFTYVELIELSKARNVPETVTTKELIPESFFQLMLRDPFYAQASLGRLHEICEDCSAVNKAMSGRWDELWKRIHPESLDERIKRMVEMGMHGMSFMNEGTPIPTLYRTTTYSGAGDVVTTKIGLVCKVSGVNIKGEQDLRYLVDHNPQCSSPGSYLDKVVMTIIQCANMWEGYMKHSPQESTDLETGDI